MKTMPLAGRAVVQENGGAPSGGSMQASRWWAPWHEKSYSLSSGASSVPWGPGANPGHRTVYGEASAMPHITSRSSPPASRARTANLLRRFAAA